MKNGTRTINGILMIISLLVFFGVNLHAQTVSMFASGDAVVFEADPEATASSFHNSNILANMTEDGQEFSYVKFDISAFANRIVTAAEFSTRGTAKPDTETTIRLRRAGTAFHRDTTTWSNRPSTGQELGTKIYTTDSGRRVYTPIDNRLINYINEELIKGSTEIAFAIQYKEGDLDAVNWIGGRGDGAWGPELIIELDRGMTFYPVDDAVAFKEDPERTAPDFHVSNLMVTRVDGDTEAVSYVKFELKGMAYKRVSAAEFSTRGTSNPETTNKVQLRRVSGTDISRATTNWGNRPNMSGRIGAKEYTRSSDRIAYEAVNNGIVNYINDVLATGREVIVFGMQHDGGDLDAGNWIGGRGDGAWGPVLSITPDGENTAAFAIADAIAFSDKPDSTASFFHNSNLLVYSKEDDAKAISFVQFDISNFSGRVVRDVKFSTRSSMASEKTMTVRLTRSGDAFHRDTTNWNNKPGTSRELATVLYDSDSGRKTFVPNGNELNDYVNSKLAAGASVLSFGLEFKDGDGADLSWIGGRGDGAWGPMLELVFQYGYNSFASDDAVVFEHAPEDVAADFHASNLLVEKTDEKNTVSFVKFNIADIAGMEIVDATFSTRGSMAPDKSMVIKLTRAGTDFTRATTNWENKPSRSGELATTEKIRASDRLFYDNVGDNLVNYINQHTLFGRPEVAFGLEFKSGDGGDLQWIGGKGDGTWGPQLELTIRSPLESDTIYVVADAFVKEAEPTENFGGAADMGIRRAGDGTSKETYLRFDISEVADAAAGAVKLTAYIAQHDSGTQREDFLVDVFAVEDQEWEEMGINWENKPDAGVRLIEENVTWFGAGQAVSWESDLLTHYINDAVREGRTHVSFVLKGKDNTPGDRLWMAGREWRPQATSLIFDYTVPPPLQTIPVVADAYVSQVEGERDANFGSEADQHLINDDANEASKWIFFKYDLSKAYGEAVSASLNGYGSIHNEVTGLDEFHFAVYGSSNVTWLEDEINWNNKPSVGNQVLLTGTLYPGGRWLVLSSPAFTDYVNAAIKAGQQSVTLVAKGVNPTPGQRAWISGKEWQGSFITLNYEPQVAPVAFAPVAENHIRSVDVTLSTSTANASIYYTINGDEPTEENGTLYVPGTPVTLTAESANETYTIRAVAFAEDLKPSIMTMKTYHVTPVGLPQFSPTPLVKYQGSVTVSISVVPEGSLIRYSDDGGEPSAIYEEPLIITEPTTIRAQAYNDDFTFATEVVEVFYDVVQTVPAPGVGPGGVGFADLSRDGQPELSLWLRAHDITDVEDGGKVHLWSDMSGNENHAHNDETAFETPIPNTGENWKAAPSLVKEGLNGWPAVNFGRSSSGQPKAGSAVANTGQLDTRQLVVDDADNLDGGAGISIFMVVKRNDMFDNFAALIQKRDIRNQPAQSSYVLEMDGGANPNKMQFVIARDIFLKSIDEFNDQDYYIVNTNLNSNHGLATFITNGTLKSSAAYNRPVQSTHAPVIIGGFQAMDVAEVIKFNSDVNNAQTKLIKNYLAAKYGLGLDNGLMYTHTDNIYDIIGIGQTADIAGVSSEAHLFSSGGALQLSTEGFAGDGDFVIAGHNGVAIDDDNDGKSWSRLWYVQTVGNGGNVTLGFDFDAAGIESTPSTEYNLWYKADASAENWTNLGVAAVVDETLVSFDVEAIQTGYYAIGILSPGASTVGVTDPSVAHDMFRLYPNPARERITLEFENDHIGHVHVTVMDIYGRKVGFETIGKETARVSHEMNLSGLKPGFYFIEVKDNTHRSVKRFMIQ